MTRQPVTAADAALRLLSRRAYTRREMEHRLQAGSFGQEELDEALNRLADWGYLDDLAVARRGVEDCLERRPRGRSLLLAELMARGIPEAVALEALAAYPPAMEDETARAVLTRLGIRIPAGAKDRARAWRTLTRLGFVEPTIERICGFPDP